MSRLSFIVFWACLALAASKSCKSNHNGDKHGAEVNFDRDINAKVCGKVKFGPCGRPKSNIDIGIIDSGETNVNGNAFNILETAGRFSEILKIVGNRFKPEVCCPPRPASNVDTSAESILAQRTVRRKPGRSSGKYLCRQAGRRVSVPDDDSGSGSGEGLGLGSGRRSGYARKASHRERKRNGRGFGYGRKNRRGSKYGVGSRSNYGSGSEEVALEVPIYQSGSYRGCKSTNKGGKGRKSGGHRRRRRRGNKKGGRKSCKHGGKNSRGEEALERIKKTMPCSVDKQY